jgi:hypothetical protein
MRWDLEAGAPTLARRFVGVSVWDPSILRKSAFCSHPVLQVRRFARSQKPANFREFKLANINELTVKSSDSQFRNKITNDSR